MAGDPGLATSSRALLPAAGGGRAGGRREWRWEQQEGQLLLQL